MFHRTAESCETLRQSISHFLTCMALCVLEVGPKRTLPKGLFGFLFFNLPSVQTTGRSRDPELKCWEFLETTGLTSAARLLSSWR